MAEEHSSSVEDDKQSSLHKQIACQVEYYFGDFNLPQDEFLQREIKKSDGWVSLEAMIRFRRLAKLTTDFEVIAAALCDSSLMEVSDDKMKIRRRPNCLFPVFDEKYKEEIRSRTLYCGSFPVENITFDNLLDFFYKFEGIEKVKPRKYTNASTGKYVFKGSAFVTFKTKEKARMFMQADTKYLGINLTKIWRSDYTGKVYKTKLYTRKDLQKEQLELSSNSRTQTKTADGQKNSQIDCNDEHFLSLLKTFHTARKTNTGTGNIYFFN